MIESTDETSVLDDLNGNFQLFERTFEVPPLERTVEVTPLERTVEVPPLDQTQSAS